MREREAECRIQLADDSVFRGWYVVGAKRSYTHAARSLDSDIHRFMLQLPAEYPAAHDPGIDFDQAGDLRVRTQNHRADKTIVAEPVDEAELQRETSIGGDEPRHIFMGMTSGRRIKLICFPDQLCDTRQIDGLEGSEDHRHLESPQKVVHALRRLKKGVARSVGRVLLSAPRVVGSEGNRLEVARVRQASDVLGCIGRQLGDSNHGEALPYARSLCGIIVDKDQTVDSDVQQLGNSLQVGGLVFPVRDEGRDIRPLQEHLWMVAEHRLRYRRVILRADGQNHTTLSQLLGVTLQRKVGFTGPGALPQDDSFRAVVTDHATPKSVVEIEDETFFRQSTLGGDDSGEQLSVRGRSLWRDFLLRL